MATREFKVPRCPSCGAEEIRTVEAIPGTCKIVGMDEYGEPVFTGWTDVVWDGQRTISLICFNCEWEYKGIDWKDKLNALT